jgi:hypothetical protein
MEVHHHSHTERRKWTHYLWEFLMLFLAVFCGFLAENQREHMAEYRREKEFMRSMVDDLYRDTAAITVGIRLLDSRLKRLDSAILLYANHKKHTPAQVAEIGRLSESGLINVTVVFADRTSSQLKNSGGMRLIRKKTVADSLTKYWNGIEVTNNSWERAQISRFESRKIGYKIFGFFHEFYIRRYIDSSFTVDSSLLDDSPLLLGEYINNVYKFADGCRAEFYPQLKQQLKLAEYLIGLIKKEYHLK